MRASCHVNSSKAERDNLPVPLPSARRNAKPTQGRTPTVSASRPPGHCRRRYSKPGCRSSARVIALLPRMSRASKAVVAHSSWISLAWVRTCFQTAPRPAPMACTTSKSVSATMRLSRHVKASKSSHTKRPSPSTSAPLMAASMSVSTSSGSGSRSPKHSKSTRANAAPERFALVRAPTKAPSPSVSSEANLEAAQSRCINPFFLTRSRQTPGAVSKDSICSAVMGRSSCSLLCRVLIRFNGCRPGAGESASWGPPAREEGAEALPEEAAEGAAHSPQAGAAPAEPSASSSSSAVAAPAATTTSAAQAPATRSGAGAWPICEASACSQAVSPNPSSWPRCSTTSEKYSLFEAAKPPSLVSLKSCVNSPRLRLPILLPLNILKTKSGLALAPVGCSICRNFQVKALKSSKGKRPRNSEVARLARKATRGPTAASRTVGSMPSTVHSCSR
mmetsp:Transcript_106812/g.341189  ORF Transcript_106812/g.341189 Transcript_106812/m.341189 type:complete len:448 (+) Transcript_106812:207-1550(+)